MRTLNLGILAHVDAGKTSLTERLLFEAGAIAELGSVDAGTTRTDSMDIERRRGITVRTNVASFAAGDVQVNLIDTPGHSDFIAEVERSLAVLDAAVLVVSAVEGVQPQTVVLWRVLRRLGVPAAIFINKIDRQGADPARVRAGIGRRLAAGSGARLFPDGRAGSRVAWRGRPAGPADRLVGDRRPGVRGRPAARRRPGRAGRHRGDGAALCAHPGGARHPGAGGGGIGADRGGRARPADDAAAPHAMGSLLSALASGVIYKIERGDHGTLAYCRMFGGELASGTGSPRRAPGPG